MLQLARQAGEHHEALRLSTDGSIWVREVMPGPPHKERRFDWVVNPCGPWAGQLLTQSDIHTSCCHRPRVKIYPAMPCLWRFFVASALLSFCPSGATQRLVSTTEETQELDLPIESSQCEREFLLDLLRLHLPSWDSQARAHGSFLLFCDPLWIAVLMSRRQAGIRCFGGISM